MERHSCSLRIHFRYRYCPLCTCGKGLSRTRGDANQIAQIPDSLYYDNATVQIKNIDTGEVFDLEKVDGNLEGYQRDAGVFADAPNYLYKIKAEEAGFEGGKHSDHRQYRE